MKKKCINCRFIGIGYSSFDNFVHCSMKYARSILNSINGKQQRITLIMARQQVLCPDFIYESKNRPEEIFLIQNSSIQNNKEAVYLAKILSQQLKSNIKTHSINF